MRASCRPLVDVIGSVPDVRRARGKRHPLAGVLALACAATLCGARNYSAMAEWGHVALEVDPGLLASLGLGRAGGGSDARQAPRSWPPCATPPAASSAAPASPGRPSPCSAAREHEMTLRHAKWPWGVPSSTQVPNRCDGIRHAPPRVLRGYIAGRADQGNRLSCRAVKRTLPVIRSAYHLMGRWRRWGTV